MLFLSDSRNFWKFRCRKFWETPAERSEKAKFAELFNSFNDYLEAARIQGFKWSKLHYEISKGAGKKNQ